MEDLSKAALRPRHWKQLIRVASTMINTTIEAFTKMNLKEFLALGFQHSAEEVRAIVKKSSKDIDVENLLKLYEEVWLSKVFETKKHTRLIVRGSSSNANNSFAVSSIKFLTLSFADKKLAFSFSFYNCFFLV